MSKKEVNGLPSDTNPYRISRGTPLSPSSACTCNTCCMSKKYVNSKRKFRSEKGYKPYLLVVNQLEALLQVVPL